MLDIIDLLAKTNGNVLSGDICSGNTLFIFQIAYSVVKIIQIAVPFALIILGSIDFFKAVVAGDEKEMKQKRKPFVQRLIAALVIFLIPIIVNLIISTFFADNSFGTCWNTARTNRTIKLPSENDINGSSNSKK